MDVLNPRINTHILEVRNVGQHTTQCKQQRNKVPMKLTEDEPEVKCAVCFLCLHENRNTSALSLSGLRHKILGWDILASCDFQNYTSSRLCRKSSAPSGCCGGHNMHEAYKVTRFRRTKTRHKGSACASAGAMSQVHREAYFMWTA